MLFRYPGGKGKVANYIARRIIPFLENQERPLFVEPFFGSGAVTFEVLSQIKCNVWINDIDPGIAAVWNSVLKFPDELIEVINQYKPTVEDFFIFKEQLTNSDYLANASELDKALRKIALHQMSFSGLGTKSGSPIGGKNQNDANGNPKKYQVDCRWSPKTLANKIKLSKKSFCGCHLAQLECTSVSYERVLENCNNDWFIYLDPPYYQMGEELYQFSFTEQDHINLAEMLKNHNNWLLSYDNCDEIRELYGWANIEELGIRYTINNNMDKCKELLICPKL